jgi:RNA recognition motif-containing protein
VWCLCRRPCYRLAAFFIPAVPEKAELKMSVKIYVGNLSRSTTQDQLSTLFAQAGAIETVELIKDRVTGESKGFAFITMNDQAEADKAISMFNAYSLDSRELKVNVAKPKEDRPSR